jgi:predicted alpha/beta-fold hydrolase
MYHAGTHIGHARSRPAIKAEYGNPVYLIGYSLGGNVALKLAGELGDKATGVLDGVIAVSTPIDLAACVRKMSRRENFIYEWRFLSRLKQRIRRRSESMPGVYDISKLEECRSVYDFDDKITAPFFGFGTADNYYATQSSNQFLDRIRIPTLLIQAKDDPLIPFDIYQHPAIRAIRTFGSLPPSTAGIWASSRTARRIWVDRDRARLVRGD